MKRLPSRRLLAVPLAFGLGSGALLPARPAGADPAGSAYVAPLVTDAASLAAVDPAISVRAREWLQRAQTGAYDRAQLEPAVSKALTPYVEQQTVATFYGLGSPKRFTLVAIRPSPGAQTYIYRAEFATRTLYWIFTLDNAGKIAGFFLRGGQAQ